MWPALARYNNPIYVSLTGERCPDMEFFATCPKGFERFLGDELSTLGCGQIRPLKGQVSFTGETTDAYRVCLWSRLASRVVLVVGRVDASSSDALYEGLRSLEWEQLIAPGATLAIDAHGTNNALRNTQFIALRAKDAIVDSLLARRGARPVVDVRNADLTVMVRVSRERATVGIDFSGEPLFRRGYEQLPGRRAPIAPLRPDYAAALLAAGDWFSVCKKSHEQESTPTMLALYSGAGTVLVEAAAAALDRAPGLSRHRWGFTGWADHDAVAWNDLMEEAQKRAARGTASVNLLAYEPRAGADAATRQMLHAAGMDLAPRWVKTPEQADLGICDLSWLGIDELAVQADALAQTTYLLSLLNDSPVVALSRDQMVDASLCRDAVQTTEVMVGRDDASIRVFAPGQTIERPVVKLGDAEVPVYVAASDQFASRLSKVSKQRVKWARREDVTCYRVYDADLPDYAVTVDLYEESLETARNKPRTWLQMYEYAPPKGVDEVLARKRLFDVLALVPRVLDVDPKNVFLRTRLRARGGSQYADEASQPNDRKTRKAHMVAGAELPQGAHLIDEGGLTFEVNFQTRLDCGIFLDHRDTRAMLREMAKQTQGSKRFLNLFAYTGTATCYAADGGMRHTTTVDLSKPSLDWARRNMARNGFTGKEHEYVQADVIQWVNEQRHTANRWDLVFCDVPTFSNSQRMRKGSFDVQRDHVELLINVSRLLTRGKDGATGGTCVFSCNLRTFKPDVAALAKAGVAIEDITAKTIPEDFKRNQRVHHCYVVKRI